MEFEGYFLLTEFSTAVILLLLYSGVLWHTFRGSKFTFVYIIVTLLILENVVLIAGAINAKQMNKKAQETLVDAFVMVFCNGF